MGREVLIILQIPTGGDSGKFYFDTTKILGHQGSCICVLNKSQSTKLVPQGMGSANRREREMLEVLRFERVQIYRADQLDLAYAFYLLLL